jgi:hypothetical protein
MNRLLSSLVMESLITLAKMLRSCVVGGVAFLPLRLVTAEHNETSFDQGIRIVVPWQEHMFRFSLRMIPTSLRSARFDKLNKKRKWRR